MRVFLVFILLGFTLTAIGQKRISREEYIEKYKNISMEEMKRSGVPASITLAQGIIESGDGNGRLATKANNHFGIKCHDWNGPSIKHDDDAKNECFRKYRNPEESYRDHSDFLTSKKRYSSLFELKPDDYKRWARGLKEAGYATSQTYAKALISVIEENELYQYDKIVLAGYKSGKGTESRIGGQLTVGNEHQVMFKNHVKYIIADSLDTYESISEELYMMSWQLPKYNDVSRGTKLQAGELVYLQPKRIKAERGSKTHMVQKGETMHMISQIYAVKERKLRERNNIPENEEPKAGTVILLRNKVNADAPKPETIKVEEKPDKNEEDSKSIKILEKDDQEDDSGEFEIEYEL